MTKISTTTCCRVHLFSRTRDVMWLYIFAVHKRFPKLPGIIGIFSQVVGVISLLIPKGYFVSLILINDEYTLAYGGLYFLEFCIIMGFNKCLWGSFGCKYRFTSVQRKYLFKGKLFFGLRSSGQKN